MRPELSTRLGRLTMTSAFLDATTDRPERVADGARALRTANSLEDLPDWMQAMIVDAEAELDERRNRPAESVA